MQRGSLGDKRGQVGGCSPEAEASDLRTFVSGLRDRDQTPGAPEQEDADYLHRETDLCDGEDV